MVTGTSVLDECDTVSIGNIPPSGEGKDLVVGTAVIKDVDSFIV